VGHKRAAVLGVLAVIAILAIVMLSGLTGIPNTGYIPYNPTLAHSHVLLTPIAPYATPTRPLLNVINFGGGLASGYANATSSYIIGNDAYTFSGIFSPLFQQPAKYLLFAFFIVIAMILTDMVAIGSRSRYHGTEAATMCVLYPVAYLLVSYSFGATSSAVGCLVSFAIGLLFLSRALESQPAWTVVYSLDVRKEDLRMKFGDAFEDLSSETTRQKLSDVGNYEATKQELTDSP
jgi:hypothetical protein